MSEIFNTPRIAINRVYTRLGDAGQTALVGGQRVAKSDLRIDCYGTVDELNAFIGQAHVSASEAGQAVASLAVILRRIQHELFNAGSILATLPADIHPHQPRITQAEVDALEREMDQMNGELPNLTSFVLPGGCRLNTDLHVCRTVCRRAERLCTALADCDRDTLIYLNRLSDALFVWSRWTNHQLNIAEILWQPNEATAGSTTTQLPAMPDEPVASPS